MNLTLISYYDKINNLTFDPVNRTIGWEMPFDYNTSRIDQGKVSVHEEVIIPNKLLEFMNVSKFNMTVNDKKDKSALFNVDNYSIFNKTVVHYVPDQNTLFDMSRNYQADKSNLSMKFVLYLK
jgi:hypothetical protein